MIVGELVVRLVEASDGADWRLQLKKGIAP